MNPLFSELLNLRDRARARTEELQARATKLFAPLTPTEPAQANIFQRTRDTLAQNLLNAENTFENLTNRLNQVDDDDDNLPTAAVCAADEDEASKEEDYFGKILVDTKLKLRNMAKERALREEQAHNRLPKFVNPNPSSTLSVSNLVYSCPIPPSDAPRNKSSYYVAISIESHTKQTSRKMLGSSSSSSNGVGEEQANMVRWNQDRAMEFTIDDVFADLQLTLYLVGTTGDRPIARSILPLSAVFTSASEILLPKRNQRASKSFLLHLLPLHVKDRMFVRSVDGLQGGLVRAREPLGTLALQIDVLMVKPLAHILLHVPPNRPLAPSPTLDEVLVEQELIKRKFRLERALDEVADLPRLFTELREWRDPLVTLWFLVLSFVAIFYAEPYEAPFFLAVFLVSLGVAKRRARVALLHVPLYQDQVLEEHTEVPNSVPKRVQAVLNMATTLQYVFGFVATWLEKLVVSWQEDLFVACALAAVLLGLGTLASLALLCATLVPGMVWRTLLFSMVCKWHIPALNTPPVVAVAEEQQQQQNGGGVWDIFCARVPDARELDHRRIAQANRAEL